MKNTARVMLLVVLAAISSPTSALADATIGAGEMQRVAQMYRDSVLRVELVRPRYRNAIFSSQPNKSIVVRLLKNDNLLGATKVSVTLSDPSGTTLADQTLQQEDRDVVFDAAALQPGRYVITCRVPNGHTPDGKETYVEQVLEVTVLPPAPDEVYFDREGICMINGKPFLPIGLWHFDRNLGMINEDDNAPREEPIVTYEQMAQRIADKGFNIAVSTGAQRDTMLLDLGAKYNMRVIQGVGLGVEPLVNAIKMARDHPALFAWYTMDEPQGENSFVEGLRRYRVLQKMDPYHPVQIAQYMRSVSITATVCDIVTHDPYPFSKNTWELAHRQGWWRSPLRLVTAQA